MEAGSAAYETKGGDNMRISTKGRYGLRCMIDLAINAYGGDQIPIKSIAEREGISENYLEQVFSVLRKAGIVKSIKGSQGGYVLAKPAYDIRAGDIIRALEGDIDIADWQHEKDTGLDPIDHILYNCVWSQINDKIIDIIDMFTLEELVFECIKANEENVLMYHI